MDTVKVALVDDQALVRQGMKALLALSENLQCTQDFNDGKHFVRQMKEAKIDADIVLLDMRMPEIDGVDVLRAMADIEVDFKVIILTTFNDTAKLKQALELGACGCLLKDVDLEELVSSIHSVHKGDIVIQAELSQSLLRPDPLLESLTPREQDILKLIAQGYSNKEIAASLYKAEGTIRNTVSSLLAKLEVRDRTQATLKAKSLGLCD
ncbi:response regulator (plasmid) [Pseudoalteromonas sp. T1lg65]|uniref:response regulator n=1 Tax=Pseudoalteromonas sp. T1lg65 TaxID=2077101 RepID=UPI003F7B062B